MNPIPDDFLADWLEQNLDPEACDDAAKLAERCRADAEKKGITPFQLDRAAWVLHGSGEDLLGLLLRRCREMAARKAGHAAVRVDPPSRP